MRYYAKKRSPKNRQVRVLHSTPSCPMLRNAETEEVEITAGTFKKCQHCFATEHQIFNRVYLQALKSSHQPLA